MSVMFRKALLSHIEGLKKVVGQSDPTQAKNLIAQYQAMANNPMTPAPLKKSLLSNIKKLEASIANAGDTAFAKGMLTKLEGIAKEIETRTEYTVSNKSGGGKKKKTK